MSHHRAIQRDTEVVHSLERGLKQSLIYFPRILIRGTLRGAQDKRLCHDCSCQDDYSKTFWQPLVATVVSHCCTQKTLRTQGLIGKQDITTAQLVWEFANTKCVYELIYSYAFLSKQRCLGFMFYDWVFESSFGHPPLNYRISGYSSLGRNVSSVTFAAVLRLYPLPSFHRSSEFQLLFPD